MVNGELLAYKASRVARLMEPLASAARSVEVVVPCSDLQATMDFFLERLGFRLEVIFPADAPSTAVISGHGVTLRLVLNGNVAAPRLRLLRSEEHTSELQSRFDL